MRPSWDQYFLGIADLIATRSKDPRTKVGAVLVKDRRILGTGFNGFPIGVFEHIEERWVTPEKYFWVCHAERNCIDMCARDGIATKGSTLYITVPPCSECAKSIIQSGIVDIVIGNPAPAHWSDNTEAAAKMLKEARVFMEFAYLDTSVM